MHFGGLDTLALLVLLACTHCDSSDRAQWTEHCQLPYAVNVIDGVEAHQILDLSGAKWACIEGIGVH